MLLRGSLCIVPLFEVDDHTGDEADGAGDEPEEVLVEQGKVLRAERNERVKMQALLKRGGKRLEPVQDRGGPRADHDADIDRAVVVKEPADERQNDQRDGGRVDEHEHRNGVLNERAQTHVGDGKREEGKDDRPDGIRNFAVCHLDEGLGAGGDKADGGLETGEGDGDGEDELPGAAEVVRRQLREGDAAVFGQLEEPS